MLVHVQDAACELVGDTFPALAAVGAPDQLDAAGVHDIRIRRMHADDVVEPSL